ncbi:Wzz/FepE/Etk N-terminal domain-containing protein [Roseomonas sp. CAU 1739]|uniref:GumC family protein n=1 Tax=Roseomonas sp. CAU 1739 TaxID=3140364 RepID=UPI00325C2C2D
MTDPAGTSPAPSGGLLPPVSLHEIAEILFRRIWSVVAIVVLSVTFASVYAFVIRGDLWVAEAKLLVRLGQEQAPLPTMLAGGQTVVATTPSHVNSEMELIRSRDLIARLVDRVDMTPQPRPVPTSLFGRIKEAARNAYHYVQDQFSELLIAIGARTRLTPREAAIEAIAGALLLETQANSNVVGARFFWPQRGVPEAILRELLNLYFEMRGTMFQGTQAVAFFTERRRETALRLQEREAALANFERDRGLFNPDEQRSTLHRRLAEADTAVQAATLELGMARTSLEQLEAAQAAGDETLASVALAGNPLQQSLATELATLGARSAGAQTTLNPQDVNVRRQRAEMASLSRQFAEQVRATFTQRRQLLEAREQQRAAILAELEQLQADLPRWYELRRDVDSTRRAYEFNDNKLNDALSVAALEEARIGNVQMVQHPTENATPVGVRKTSLIMLSTAAGLVLALAWVALRTFFDHRLYGRSDVEKHLGLRVLAVAPRVRRPQPVA